MLNMRTAVLIINEVENLLEIVEIYCILSTQGKSTQYAFC